MKVPKILLLRMAFALIFDLWIVFGPQQSKAQPLFYPQSKPMLGMDGQNACWESADLDLTNGQKKAVKDLQQAYALEASPLRIKLMSLRFELRHLIRDPDVQPKFLLARQKKVSELQANLSDLSLSYQIKARSIFTKEQFAKFPQDCSLGMEVGYGLGVIGGKDHIRR